MRSRIASYTALVALAVFIRTTAQAQEYTFEQEPHRLALIIGNSAYANLPLLPSATVDATTMANRLRSLHFDIEPESTLSSVSDFEQRILPAFAATVRPGDVVVIYFSGHGFSYGQHSWLAPLNMPAIVSENALPDTAVSIDNIGGYLGKRSPALVLVLIDACRAIASFVLTDDNGLNVVRTGIAADGRFADGVNGMIGYAAQPGKAALGTSISGKPSIFTSSLSAHVDSVGADFGVVFKTVSAEVGMVTSDSQAPSLLDWSQSQLFLNPTPQIVEVWKTLWMNALASGDWARVARYARQFATSNYAAAARKWLADHPRPTLAASYTAVSPAAVEASWSGSDASIAVRPNAIGVGFNRVLDVSQMPLLAALSATELGADEHGRAGEVAAEVRGDVATAVAHREVVTLRAFAARAAPSSFSSIVYDVQPGTSIRVLGITSTDATGSWVAARLSSDNPVIYMKMKAVEERPSALQLGRALVELDVPLSSTGVRGAIEDTVISKAIRRLQEQGKLITWASLATGPASGPFGSDINESMIMHAEGALKRSGLSGRRITSVSSSQDYQKTGVRVRVFGWDP